jgi:hypothetical protein
LRELSYGTGPSLVFWFGSKGREALFHPTWGVKNGRLALGVAMSTRQYSWCAPPIGLLGEKTALETTLLWFNRRNSQSIRVLAVDRWFRRRWCIYPHF